MADYCWTPTGAGAKNGNGWANAFDTAAIIAWAAGNGHGNGDTIAIMAGSYTLTANLDFHGVNALAADMITLIPVKAGTTNVGAAIVSSDFSTSTDRPVIDGGSFQIYFGNYYQIMSHLSFISSHTYPIRTSAGFNVVGGYYENDSGISGASYVFLTGGDCSHKGNDIYSAKTRGISNSYRCSYTDCHIKCPDNTHGYGVLASSYCHVYVHCIFDTCGVVAINQAANYSPRVTKCTFYNCPIAVDATSAYNCLFTNNIIDNCATGFKWTTNTKSNIFYGNHKGNNVTTMYSGCAQEDTLWGDPAMTTGDPLFTNPGTDFSLQYGSPCAGTAEDIGLAVGATPRHGNKGASQAETGTTLDLPAIGNVLNTDTLLGVAGTFDENARNVPPALGVAALITGQTAKIRNVDYNGTFDEDARNIPPALGAAALIPGQTAKIRNVDYNGSFPADDILKSAGGNYNDDNLVDGNVRPVAYGIGATGDLSNLLATDAAYAALENSRNNDNGTVAADIIAPASVKIRNVTINGTGSSGAGTQWVPKTRRIGA